MINPEQFTAYSIPAFFALFGIFAYISYRNEVKRTEGLKALATRLGLQFSPEGSLITPPQTPLFQLGRAKRIKSVLSSSVSNGLEVKIFDYSYTTGHGKSKRTTHQTVTLVKRTGDLSRNAEARVEFCLRPEGVFDVIAGALGFQDIDLPNFPKFSKMYHLSSSNQFAAQQLFNPTAVTFFENRPGWTIESTGETLVLFRARERKSLEEIPAHLQEARGIAGMFGFKEVR